VSSSPIESKENSSRLLKLQANLRFRSVIFLELPLSGIPGFKELFFSIEFNLVTLRICFYPLRSFCSTSLGVLFYDLEKAGKGLRMLLLLPYSI